MIFQYDFLTYSLKGIHISGMIVAFDYLPQKGSFLRFISRN